MCHHIITKSSFIYITDTNVKTMIPLVCKSIFIYYILFIYNLLYKYINKTVVCIIHYNIGQSGAFFIYRHPTVYVLYIVTGLSTLSFEMSALFSFSFVSSL